MTLTELMQAFCETLGLPYEPAVEGAYNFKMDAVELSILDLEEQHRVAFLGDAGMPPPERLEGLYRLALEAQYLFRETYGATLSIHPETSHICLCQSFDVGEFDAARFFAAVEQFVNTLEVWQKIVANYRAPSEAVGEAAKVSDDFFGGNFIQV